MSIHKYISFLIENAHYLIKQFCERKVFANMHFIKVENGIFTILLSRNKLLSV